MERSEEPREVGLDAWVAVLRSLPDLGLAEITRDEQRALLDLTRIAAHRSERIAAPITAYLVGLALAPLDPVVRAERIRQLASALDPEGRA
jgi:Domain of unknown function (DUF6457)